MDEKQRKNFSAQLVRLMNEKIGLEENKKLFVAGNTDLLKRFLEIKRQIDALAKAIQHNEASFLLEAWEPDEVDQMLKESSNVEVKRK